MRPHGRDRYVIDKCRCGTCRQSNREYVRWLSKQHAYGRPRYVDATPAREHLRELMAAGMGHRRISHIAEVPHGTVSKLLYGNYHGRPPSKRIRQQTADRLLAVRLDLADAVPVPSVGTRRRLRALVAIGWSMSKLAERLGVQPGNFGPLIHSRERITRSTATAVSELYDQLWDQPPPEGTHRDRVAASRARNYARRHGWVPPMAWDDDEIDDPDAVPDVGESIDRRESPLPPADELRFLISCGESAATIAARFGVQERTVSSRLREVST